MKRTFFLFLIAFFAVATVTYLAWLVGDAFYRIYKDWRLGKEVAELEAWTRDRKRLSAGEAGQERPSP